MVKRTENIQVAAIATVGHGLSWPQFNLCIEENSQESSGGRFQINGADRAAAARWLRSAADAIERGETLKLGSFQ